MTNHLITEIGILSQALSGMCPTEDGSAKGSKLGKLSQVVLSSGQLWSATGP